MKRSALFVLTLLVALLAALWLAGWAGASRNAEPLAPQAGAPTVVSYQGQVTVSGTPHSGPGYFKFAIVNAAGDISYWSNDGKSSGGGEPEKPVELAVSSGLFSVLLGDTGLDNMTGLPASAFAGADRWLRVWFSSDNSTFVWLSPDRRIAAAPYALQAEEAASAARAGDADTLDGQHASAFAASGHTHATLTAGTGLSGSSYNGGTAATFAVTYGTAAGTAVQGNQTATITAGTGLTGGVSGDALGDGLTATLNVGGGNGITASADNLALGPLTAHWNQTGAFDIVLGNAASELQILESAGTTYYGTFDVGDLSANQIYTFGAGGTVWTSGNDGSGSTLDADLLDGQQGAYYQDASSLNAGTVATDRYSAHADLGAEGYLGDAAGDVAQNNGTLQTTLNADLLDGLHASAFRQQQYGNVVVVAQSGGDFTSVQAALNSITDASDTQRYLVWVAPGVYIETVTMKQYVDIEGAGELLTTISYTGGATGTVIGANNAELRFLTARNTGGVTSAYAIFNSSASPRLTQVTATASGGTYNFGVYNYGSSPTMTNITASASGGASSYGVYNATSASPTMTNVSATASEGSYSYGVYNYASASPTMTNVTASASGGTSGYGVYNSSSASPTMTNVSASASGSTYNYGVYNDLSSPTMTNVTATASGGASTYGVSNNASSPTIQNSTIRASGGTSSNYGIYNAADGGSYTVKVNNCQVTGSTNTIRADAEFTVRIGASQLDGGAVTGGGTVTCIGVYDENYASPGYTTCP